MAKPVKNQLTKLSDRASDMATEIAMVSVYLSRGLFRAFSKDELTHLCEEGEDNFVREICFYAEAFVEWRRRMNFDYDDLSSGVFLYEEAEQKLPKMIARHFRERQIMPSQREFLDLVVDLCL